MGLLQIFLNWSFISVAFGVYGATQILLGLIFITDSWQSPTGVKSRVKKLTEMIIPLVLGLLIGFFFEIGPDEIAKQADNRAVYFSFAGGVSAIVHAAVETTMPAFFNQALSNIRTALTGSARLTQTSPTETPKQE